MNTRFRICHSPRNPVPNRRRILWKAAAAFSGANVLCFPNPSSQVPSVPWSSASTTPCQLRHIETVNMPATALPCIIKRNAIIVISNRNTNHVSLKPISAAFVGIASGRTHNTLPPHPVKSAYSPPNWCLPASCSKRTLLTTAILQAIKARREPRQASRVGRCSTNSTNSFAGAPPRSQKKRYPDDRHIRLCIGTYPPSGNARVILALDEVVVVVEWSR